MEESLLNKEEDFDFSTDPISSTSTPTIEDIKFTLNHPFITLMKLCAGPLIFSIAATFQDIFDLYFVKKGYDQAGVIIIGMAAMMRFIILHVTNFSGGATTVKISALIAEKQYDKAGQLIVDILRLYFIVSLIFPIIAYFTMNIFLEFLQGPEKYFKDAINYLWPILFVMFFVSTFQLLNCALIGEARSNLCAIIQIISLIISLFIADPIFIFILKVPITKISFAYCSGPIICGIILFILYFNEYFSVKPKLSMFLKPFSDIFWPTIKLSFSFLINLFAGVFPPTLMMRYANYAAKSSGINEDVMAVMSAMIKPYNLLASASIGALAGLAPAVSYSFASKDFKRVKQLFFYSLIVPLSISIIFLPLLIFKPEFIMKIWLNHNSTLLLAKKMVPIIFYTFILFPLSEVCNATLISTGYSSLATIPPFSRALSMIIGVLILHFSNKNDPIRILYCFSFQDIGLFLAASLSASVPLNLIFKKIK